MKNMKTYLVKFREKWSLLSLREKQVISVGSIFVLCFFFYELIWSPLFTYNEHLRTRLSSQQKTLAAMQTTDAAIKQLKHTNAKKIANPIDLLAILQHKIDAAGLSQNLIHMKQASRNTIEMQFQKVVFDELIKLLIATTREEGVSISQLAITSENMQGIVNANVVLKLS